MKFNKVRHLPTGRGQRMFLHSLSSFLTSTDLIKDIFSCKAKSCPCHPERSASEVELRSSARRSRAGSRARISSFSPRRSRCYASPYGFDCGRRTRLPPLRMTRVGYCRYAVASLGSIYLPLANSICFRFAETRYDINPLQRIYIDA